MDHRIDLYLNHGALEVLPKTLDNYHTSYFHKLEQIIKFNKNPNEQYEKIKDTLANSIRVVLETFFSFTFANLRISETNRKSSGLSDFVKLIQNQRAELFAAKADSKNPIKDKKSLIEAVNAIITYTNIESHGTAQDVTDIKFITEQELTNITQQALNIIAAFNSIHFAQANELSN